MTRRPRLSDRQLLMLRLAADGLTTGHIAVRLSWSFWTVKNEMVRARETLRARNTTHAVAIAMRNGLLADAGRPAPRSMTRIRLTGTGWPA